MARAISPPSEEDHSPRALDRDADARSGSSGSSWNDKKASRWTGEGAPKKKQKKN